MMRENHSQNAEKRKLLVAEKLLTDKSGKIITKGSMKGEIKFY